VTEVCECGHEKKEHFEKEGICHHCERCKKFKPKTEFNFKKEIRAIPINEREKQIINIVEERFEEFIKKLKEFFDEDYEKDYIDKLSGYSSTELKGGLK
jgi:hypothetical protein